MQSGFSPSLRAWNLFWIHITTCHLTAHLIKLTNPLQCVKWYSTENKLWSRCGTCRASRSCGRRAHRCACVICILMLKCVGRCLDSSANKVAESSSGEKTRPSVKRWCGENGVALAGGLLWFTNAASVAAAVALLWWRLLTCTTQL